MKFKLLLFLLLGSSVSAQNPFGYFRFPAIHDNIIVFTAEGDLWVKNLNQSQATRLTTNSAEEKQAAISPDGKLVAYSANYKGTTEVYAIPVDGGVASRVSFENSNVKVHGWSQAGEVLYSTTSRIGPANNWTLRLVHPTTLVSKTIPLADAVEGTIDNGVVYFIQFGLQVSKDNSRVYRGGAMGELWRFQLGSNKEADKLTGEHHGSVRQPMVFDGRVYFISDSSGNDNIWSMKTSGSDFKQLTRHNDFSVRSARMHEGKIVYQLGADIFYLDIASNGQRQSIKSSKQDITLTSDFPNLRDRWIRNPLKYLHSSNLANDHEKVVITARGRVVVASTDKSRLVEINTPADSRTRAAVLSDDGKWVYTLIVSTKSETGEMEIWQFAADGSDRRKQLTNDGSVCRWQLSLSPDGKWIAHDDQNGDLWLLNLTKGKNKKILSKNTGSSPLADLVWSPDSKVLAITESKEGDERLRIRLYEVEKKRHKVLTSDKYNSYSPAFSHDGKWLYFLSERHFSPTPLSPWGDRNMGINFDRRVQIFAYALRENAKFPFQSLNELVKPDEKVNRKFKNQSKDTAAIDWGNIEKRLWQVPVKSGNYSSLQANSEFLFVLDKISEPESKPCITSIKIKPSTRPETFAENVAQFKLSEDGQSIFVRKEGGDNENMFIVKAGAKFPEKAKNFKVNINGWQLKISPKQEWRQMFADAWLMHRDYFFDRNLRGHDWKNARKKYLPLLERTTDRYELDDIFSQMIGELNALHSQVGGGDYPEDFSQPVAATLGAFLEQKKRGVRIAHIYEYDKEVPEKASPLCRPGVDARQGDIIVAVNGNKVYNIEVVYDALLNQAGKQVLLELKRKNKTHKTIVIPVTVQVDSQLRYNDWVTRNRKKVENASADIGYLHLDAMQGKDIADFAREFYAVYKKGGLVIDVRRNRGGNIDSWVIEKLLRKAWMFWGARTGTPWVNMQQTFRGHLVVLADQLTYSDGETFTAGIKALNLGYVIGKKTAGAGVWLRNRNRLVDGGIARVAEFPQYAMDGRWIIEGKGVKPKLEVDNLPYKTFNGEDAQLKAAITYLKRKLSREPVRPLKAKPFMKKQP